MRRRGTWRRAGGMDAGELRHPETGVVQGGVSSPVLAQVFRPHVLEACFAREVRPRMQGRGVLRRLADACVMGCEREADARRSMAVRPKRLARVGVRLHPEQTTVLAFRHPDTRTGPAHGTGTGDVLGVTHDWPHARRGLWVIQRRTARTRLRRTQTAWWRWCRTHRQAPVTDPYPRLCLQVRGHVRSDGMRGHVRLLAEVRRCAEQAWRDWRSRRSRTRAMGGEPCQQRLKPSGLPTPTLVHHR